MKKITFILLALISGTAFAQSASDETKAFANIVSPINIMAKNPLIFGDITPNQGIVVVRPEGFDAGATTATIVGNVVPTAATFDVNAADDYVYNITLPATVILSRVGGGGSMTLNGLLHNASLKGKGGIETFSVGGTLFIADAQPTGSYEGTVTVGVAYQ